MADWRENGPLVIGGVGGSGTRVIADIVNTLGFFIGNDLNQSNDALLYTLLFKRPEWFRHNWRSRAEVERMLDPFERLFLRPPDRQPRAADFKTACAALAAMALHGHTADGAGRGIRFALGRLLAMLPSPQLPSPCIGWGWKEPNSHMILDHLAVRYPKMRYIHVIRHGLDMALSSNRQQVENWAQLFEIPQALNAADEIVEAFRYWALANERAAGIGEALGPNRFILLRFEDMLDRPADVIEQIAAFAGVELADSVRDAAAARIHKPKSAGRYREHVLENFPLDELVALTRYGYSKS